MIVGNDDYGSVIRRCDNQRLNVSAESDGRRNGIINIHAHLKSDDSLRRQQQLEASRFLILHLFLFLWHNRNHLGPFGGEVF